MGFSAILHTGLTVSDLDRSVAFTATCWASS